jgi:hypothetical protein
MGSSICFVLATCCVLSDNPPEQAVISGRVREPVFHTQDPAAPLGNVYLFAAQNGPGARPFVDRSWSTDPVGWYRLAGPVGDYTLLATDPAGFMRPVVMPMIHAIAGQNKCDMRSHADYAVFSESDWDRQPAEAYYQPFVARGHSVTHVGFKLVHDGVDGFRPGSQDLDVSIRHVETGPPGNWKQIGPTIPVLGVDCGGAKNRAWSVGWNSGEVAVEPGKGYAVCLKARRTSGVFQAFWQTCSETAACCYRQGRSGALERTAYRLWMSAATDDDELVIPYNKRVHREFGDFAGFARKWSQTYVAQGDSLAGVVLYAAVGGTQPPLSRQHVAIRVRRGGPSGPSVGTERTTVGNGIYTGDASWGIFGTSFTRNEVPLIAGTTYAVEIETLESPATLHGFVNIKGQVSDERPGFNPYRKIPPDTYEHGAAFRDGKTAVGVALDMQVVEYTTKASSR